MLNTAIILAGGFGTRLRSLVSDLPKPMAPVNNKPFLYYQLKYLQHFGIKHVIISTGHLAEKISDYFGNKFENMDLSYSYETEALGTGGGIRLAMEKSIEKFVLVLNGDSFFELPLHDFYNKHINYRSSCSLALREVQNASRYGAVETDDQHQIVSFKEKSDEAAKGLINCGVYIIETSVYLSHTKANQNFSIEKDYFQTQLKNINMKGFSFNGYFIDIGIPEDYQQAQHDFKGFKY